MTSSVTMPVPVAGRRWRFGARTRKALLLVHLLVTGAWIGLDVAMALLVFTAAATDDPRTAAVALQALRFVTVWPMLTAGLLSLASGVLLGLGTKYGLVRYWWVLIKLIINVVLCVLVLFALRPGVAEAARAGQELAAGGGAWRPGDLIFPPIVSPTALLIAFLLSVFKPWGRLRRAPKVGGTRSGPGAGETEPASGRRERTG